MHGSTDLRLSSALDSAISPAWKASKTSSSLSNRPLIPSVSPREGDLCVDSHREAVIPWLVRLGDGEAACAEYEEAALEAEEAALEAEEAALEAETLTGLREPSAETMPGAQRPQSMEHAASEDLGLEEDGCGLDLESFALLQLLLQLLLPLPLCSDASDPTLVLLMLLPVDDALLPLLLPPSCSTVNESVGNDSVDGVSSEADGHCAHATGAIIADSSSAEHDMSVDSLLSTSSASSDGDGDTVASSWICNLLFPRSTIPFLAPGMTPLILFKKRTTEAVLFSSMAVSIELGNVPMP